MREKHVIDRRISGLIAVLLFISRVTSSQAAFVSNVPRSAKTNSLTKGLLGQTQSKFMGAKFVSMRASQSKAIRRGKGTELGMFLGSDGGLLGVGAPEVAATLLVGYFILGPSELYKLTKEIGKFIQNFRTLGSEASKSFESTMENQLELDELRKAQSELNNAFNFRRSINNDVESDFYTEPSPSVEVAKDVTGASAVNTVSQKATAGEMKKKRKRRRKKKKVKVPEDVGSTDIPDLDMSAAFNDEITEENTKQDISDGEESEEDFTARIREERLERLQSGGPTEESNPDWASALDSDVEKEVLGNPISSVEEQAQSSAEQSRFAAQLSGNWNAGIIENEDKLSPLAKVMDRLAILEKERDAANARLVEEFRQRTEVEEKYYREKRAVLEETAAEISSQVYGDFGRDDSST